MFLHLLEFGSIAGALYLKVQCYIFVRMLPLGYKFLPKITASFIVFLSSFILQSFTNRNITQTSPRRALLRSILGVYTPRRKWANIIACGFNILVYLCTLDFLYRPLLFPATNLSFSRVGFVTSSSARLVFRHPSAVPFNITYSTSHIDNITISSLIDPKADHTATVILSDRLPNTKYQYTSTLNHTGTFLTSSPPSSLTKFRIISTSCQKPFYPYSPFKNPLSIDGLRHLAEYIRGDEEFILFLGDFIYSDLPVQLEAYTEDYYTKLYRQVYASPDWTPELRGVPWIHMFDDHELVNDYYPSMDEHETMYHRALAPFRYYQQQANPPREDRNMSRRYTSFVRGDASFFILDTRSYRSTPPAKEGSGRGERTMLGAEQLEELKTWMKETKGWKVIVSGVSMTRNWSGGGDEMDSWAGYLDEREEIFELLWEYGGGVIISGDRHEHATVTYPPPSNSSHPASHAIVEFSTSPLSFFFQPFTREYVKHDDTDVTLYHHYHGSSKFGVFDFESVEGKWKVGFTLVVDGKEEWTYEHFWEPRV